MEIQIPIKCGWCDKEFAEGDKIVIEMTVDAKYKENHTPFNGKINLWFSLDDVYAKVYHGRDKDTVISCFSHHRM